MSIKTEVVKTIVNEVIHDSYGRVYGQILGFSVDSPRSIPLIWVEQQTGEVTSCPSSEITLDHGRMIVDTSWTVQATQLQEAVHGLLRKLSALDDLYATGEIVKDAYDTIREDYETTLHSLTHRRQQLALHAKERSDELTAAVSRLEVLLATSKLEHALGYLEDDAARLIVNALRDGLRRAVTEKQEVEATIDALAEVSPPPETSAPPTVPREDASSPPILLRIKEAGL
jgi:hypothetical protein